jgi:uncharacterized protein (TIGR02271 family)
MGSGHEGGCESRPLPERPAETFIVRHEEEMRPRKAWRLLGFLRARRTVRVERLSHRLPADAEKLVQEHVPVGEGDSGQIETLPDGSVSIPLYQEELIVTRRVVLRERVILRKQVIHRPRTIRAELRREAVDIQVDEGIEVVDERAPARTPARTRTPR